MSDLSRHYAGAGELGGSTPAAPGNRTNVVAIKELLERARADDIFVPVVDMKPVPKNTAETATWRRIVNDEVSTDTITEGVNPDWQSISYEDVSGTFEERVEVYAVTSRAKTLSEDDHVANSVDQLKDKILRIRNAVGWSKWLAGTTVLYNDPAHSDRVDVDGPVTLGIIQEAVRLLNDAKGEFYTEVDNGGLNNGTVGLEPSYMGLCHTNLLPDFRRVDGFTTPAEYGSAKAVSKYEKGSIENTRFLMSPELTGFPGEGADATSLNLKSTDNSGPKVDVYPILICAKAALGCADLKGTGKSGWGNIGVEILDKPDKYDPANLNTLVVGHWWDLQLILNDQWVVRLEVGATADLTLLD